MPGQVHRFSALTWRIIAFNAIALIVMIGGVILVQTSSTGLVEERLTGIQEQAQIVAGTLAEYATDSDTHTLKVEEAKPLLRQLIAPTRLRGRLYLANGMLAIDTRDLLALNLVETATLPPLDRWSRFKAFLLRVYDGVMGVRPFARLAPYYEAGDNGRVYGEVDKALTGDVGTAERVDQQNKLVLSVAVPIQRFRAIYGVLLVSTEGGDIDNILRQERATLIEVFLVALVVMLMSSLYLAGTIAEPVRRLAAAADRVRSGHAGREPIPVLYARNDEIGELSENLSAMTRALYERIDAIESFAADVAHELKNPLTSLKSAMEMMLRTPGADDRARLLEILRGDVKRIDRLITDISDASRLDAELSREASERVDMGRLLETLADVYRFTEIARGIDVELQSELPPGTTVLGRDERIGQVFRNLIDNAVSFSPPGGRVTIRALHRPHMVQIFVEDEGPGIPPENLESIFGRFYTERPSDHFGKNSGLGLSIARQIVQRVGGRIWAENRPSKDPAKDNGGARFVVELPLVSG